MHLKKMQFFFKAGNVYPYQIIATHLTLYVIHKKGHITMCPFFICYLNQNLSVI